jgi:hypothetical protein
VFPRRSEGNAGKGPLEEQLGSAGFPTERSISGREER